MKIVLALVLVACVAVQAAPAAKKVKGECRRMSLCPSVLKKKDGKLVPVLQKDKCTFMYWFCPADAHGKVDSKHCKKVKKCGGGKGKWVKVGDDGPEHFEPAAGDHHHKHKKCKDGDDSDEDGDHKHKRRCKHGDESGDESGGESDGDDDDDDKDEDGDKKKKRKCKKKHGSDGEDSDGSGDSGSDSDHKHGCKKHGSDDSGDDSD